MPGETGKKILAGQDNRLLVKVVLWILLTGVLKGELSDQCSLAHVGRKTVAIAVGTIGAGDTAPRSSQRDLSLQPGLYLLRQYSS